MDERWQEHQDRWARERLEPALERAPERKARFITQSGVEINRVYTPADLADPANDPDAGRPRYRFSPSDAGADAWDVIDDIHRLKARVEEAKELPLGPLAVVADPSTTPGGEHGTRPMIAIGASTGGTEAVRVVLEAMPPDAPPILVTQHIPAAFSGPFAQRMDRVSAMRVCEAQDGQSVQSGHVYIAPGGAHLLMMWDGARYVCRLHDGPAVNRHKPSVDVLFRSVALCAGAGAVAALLTGMGDDGARGLLELKQAGAATLVQDEETSVVWGMPGAAWKLGAASEQLPLDHMAARLLALARAPRGNAGA